jgi:ribosomal-protein-alanine N-acetyltransferase
MKAIRPARLEDIERIYEIERKCFPTPWPTGALRGHLGERGFIVYELSEMVVGYIIVGMKTPSFFERLEMRAWDFLGYNKKRKEEKVGHIMNIAVDPAYRNKGIGEELLRKGLLYLQSLGVEVVELEVRVNNVAAIKLYRKFGFSTKQVIKGYYSNGDDAYLMRKGLKDEDFTYG